jgi:hypothetical protein
MSNTISRRRLLQGAGIVAGTAAIAAPSVLRGQAAIPRVTSVTLQTGFTVILNEYMAAKRFDLKHGVNIDVINSYVSVTNYYNDFTAGTFEVGVGSWDTWAARFLAGVPLKLISTLTDFDLLNIVALQGGPASVADLRGKTLAATLSSGAYRIAKHTLAAFHKLEAGKDYSVQNTESPAGAVAMVLGGSAQAGLTWEPNVSVGLRQDCGCDDRLRQRRGGQCRRGREAVGRKDESVRGSVAQRVRLEAPDLQAGVDAGSERPRGRSRGRRLPRQEPGARETDHAGVPGLTPRGVELREHEHGIA